MDPAHLLGAVLAARLERSRSGGGRVVSQAVVDSTSRAAILHMRSYTSKSRTLWSRAETEGRGQVVEDHAETDEILLWVVCGEESDLEICRDRGLIGTPAHQQAYLRNVGGGKAAREVEAAISSPKSKTLLDYEEIL